MLDGSLRIGSLFSGIGGFELGLEWAGLGHTVFQVECDAYCLEILAQHWPNVPRYTDILDVGAHNLPPCDLLIGGFPCQDISKAGQGAGLDGERSGLFYEFARLIGELRPRLVIMENVAAILGRGLDSVLGTLAALGYDAEWDCVEASSIGAPHARDRWFLVAYPNSDGDGCKPRRRVFEVRRGDELGGGRLPRDWATSARSSRAQSRGRTATLANTQGEPGGQGRPTEAGRQGGLAGGGPACMADPNGLGGSESGHQTEGEQTARTPRVDPRVGGGVGPLADTDHEDGRSSVPGLGGSGLREEQRAAQRPGAGGGEANVSDADSLGRAASLGGNREGVRDQVGEHPAPERRRIDEQPGAREDSGTQGATVADAHGDGAPREEQSRRLGRAGGSGAARASEPERERERERGLPDSDGERLAQREGEPHDDGSQQSPPQRSHRDWRQGPDRVEAESRLGGAPYGVPAWLDGSWEDGLPRVVSNAADRAARLRCLGNAVVPQVAAYIAERIKQAWRE